jgi:hypothetical protein
MVVLSAPYGVGMTAARVARHAPTTLLDHVRAYALGYGFLEVFAFSLGWAGAFSRTTLSAIAIAAAAAAGCWTVGWMSSAWSRLRATDRRGLPAVALGAVVGYMALLASAPPTSGDAISYHLTAPKVWLEAGRLFPIWWDWTTFQPFATEMQYAYAEALSGGRAASIVGAGLCGLSALCVFGMARAFAGHTVGILAAAIWVVQGMFVWEATGAFVDAVVGGFVALALWELVIFARSKAAFDAATVGLAVGLAASTKYLGLLFVPPALVAVAYLARQTRPVRATALALAGTAVVAPWLIRTYHLTGNPVYPLVFGGRYWTHAAAATQASADANYGVAGWWRFPFFPLEFIIDHARFEKGYSFGPALLAAPAALAVRQPWVRTLALGTLVYLVLWFGCMHQITRYLLPVMPVVVLLAALGWLVVTDGGRRRKIALLAGVVAIVPWLAITAAFSRELLPGALGIESRAAFVQRLTGSYDALHWLDTNLPPSGRVAVGAQGLYWLKRPYVRLSIPFFGPGESPATIVTRLRSYDVRYVAVVDGVLPASLAFVRPDLKQIARVPFTDVTSRALAHSTAKSLVVYAWCAARPSPCST